MKTPFTLATFVAASLMLTGCLEVGGGGGGLGAAPPGNEPEAAARAACLRDVQATTGNPTASVVSSSFSEAGTQVIVAVGPQQAQWSCIAYRDGTTTGIQSLTNEGFL